MLAAPDRPPIWITSLALDSLCPGPSRIAAPRFPIKLDGQEVADLPKPLVVAPIPSRFCSTGRPLAWRIGRAAEFAEWPEMACSVALTLFLALPGQRLSTGPIVAAPPLSEDAAVRLAYMKDTVAAYRIHRRAAGSPLFKLRAEPIFRLDNPVTSVKDSAFFFWTDPETGRPEVTIQMFRAPTKYWIHDWTSLSTSPIVAEIGSAERWWPKAGVEFLPVPGCSGSRGNSRGPAAANPSPGRGILGHR